MTQHVLEVMLINILPAERRARPRDLRVSQSRANPRRSVERIAKISK